MKKIILIGLATFFISGCWETEKGEKIGIITKISKQGVLIKTNEAELIRGGLNDGSGNFGRSFHFTIEDKNLVEIAQQAMDSQKKVRITYHKELATLGRTETKDNSFVDNIEISK